MNKKNLLLLLTALVASSIGVQAAEPTEQYDTQILQAELSPSVEIKADGAMQTRTMTASNGNLSEAFASKFTITANDSLNLYLYAKTQSKTGTKDAFFKQGDQVFVVLSNTTVAPESSAIDNITSGATSATDNPNAIAYPVNNITLSDTTLAAPVFDPDKKQYSFGVKNGVTTAITSIGPAPMTNTYSYDDRAGKYQAVVTLTDTST